MKKIIGTILMIMVYVVLFPPTLAHGSERDLKASIIIDDFGGGTGGVKQFLEGDIPITAAVMPFTPRAKEHALWAHKNGIEVMVHLPMEPKKGKRSWLGPKPITVDLSTQEVRKRVEEAIDTVPYAKGMNNHMGSLAVENERIVREIVTIAKERRMYIVDSGTSPNSKFTALAKELGVPILSRDVFLDDISSAEHVRKQMSKLARITERKGTGIAIGHVGVSGNICSSGVFQSIGQFSQRGIKIVPVSQLLSKQMQEMYFHHF
ncbi:MAG: divergent polysaccharide deacetylase family protein [Bacillota bacterium]|nr:divergent polysaccharide deacetylase family protein [Bacillota bacterium]